MVLGIGIEESSDMVRKHHGTIHFRTRLSPMRYIYDPSPFTPIFSPVVTLAFSSGAPFFNFRQTRNKVTQIGSKRAKWN